MDKFKVQSTGSGYKRSLKAYENYKEKFKYYNATLIGDYQGKDIKTLIEWQGIVFHTTPKNFIMQTVKRFENLKEQCNINGDRLIRITKKEGTVVYVEIETFDGGLIEISFNNYGQFIRSRKRFLDKLSKEKFKYRGAYIGANRDIEINFGCKHGYVKTTPMNFLDKRNKGTGCVICGKEQSAKIANDSKLIKNGSFAENHPELLHLWSDKNKLSPYEITSKSKKMIYWKCENGHEDYPQTPSAKIGQNQSCPKCSMSKGEKIIGEYLDGLNIEFEAQFVIGRKKWRYDLFVPKFNLIIEVHGLQHYEEVDYFTQRTLEEEQENDTQKKEYAESKGYNYMVVDYREHLPELTLQRFKKMFEKYVMNN